MKTGLLTMAIVLTGLAQAPAMAQSTPNITPAAPGCLPVAVAQAQHKQRVDAAMAALLTAQNDARLNLQRRRVEAAEWRERELSRLPKGDTTSAQYTAIILEYNRMIEAGGPIDQMYYEEIRAAEARYNQETKAAEDAYWASVCR
ncbi:MAG: hypothetical protein AB7G93_10890 [Bdellovibrionales bacterium]